MATTHELEVSFDPLSDLTPTWTDLSSRLLEVPTVRVGVDGDLDEPQPGSATFRLDNRDRALEPGYAASAYFPNVRPLRRIRYRINDGSTDWEIFYGYILSWGPTWPGGMNQEAIIQAVDGSVILEMDTLPNLDPPAASTYEEVVMHDQPFGFWHLNDPVGATQALAVSGPEGTYKSRTLLTQGQPGAVVGDPADTAVLFNQSGGVEGRVEIPMSDTEYLSDGGAISVEAWVDHDTAASSLIVVSGPRNTGTTEPWVLGITAADAAEFLARVAPSTDIRASGGDLSPAGWHHLVGTYADGLASIYVDGVLVDTTGGVAGPLITPTAGQPLRIAYSATVDIGFEGLIDEVAVYEHALPADRVLAHYNAGIQGFEAQLAGERVAAVADSGLWAETDIATGTHEVMPVMSHGQSRLEEIKAAVKAEFPSAMFYFQGDGDPRYLGWDYGDTAPFNTVQVIIGNHGGGEVPFESIDTTDEDELYNIVTVSREGGLAQTATDAASEAEFFPRNYDLTGLIHTDDEDCSAVAAAILADHSQPDPPVRVRSVTLTSDNALALAEILERQPGDLIRVKHRPKGGTAIDIITRIRGRTLNVAPLDGGNRVISATWTLGRGFNAAVAEWRLGVVGFSELQTTTALG